MNSFKVVVTYPLGIHARPAALLASLQQNYFPKHEIIVIDSRSGAEAHMGSIMALMNAAVVTGNEIEFLTVMPDDAFRELRDVVLALSFEGTLAEGRIVAPDGHVSSAPVLECKGSRARLIEELRRIRACPGMYPMFEAVGAAAAVHAPSPVVAPAEIIATSLVKRVFVSYSRSDRGFVETILAPIIRGAGMVPWYDLDSIRGADRWERCILQGLQNCDWFVVVMSPHALGSEWVQLEVQWAAGHRKGRILPIMLSECDPWALHLHLGSLQYVDFRNPDDTARRKVLEVFRAGG